MTTSQDSETRYVCKECSKPFPIGEAVKFCQNCGARVSSVGTTATIDTRTKPLVLLVDDSNVARHKVAGILRALNCDVLEATGGQQALDKLASTTPNLVVLDINMPIVGGLQVLQQIRASETHAKLPVLLLTGEADVKVVARALALRPNAYIRKDDPVDSIRSRLAEHLDKLDR